MKFTSDGQRKAVMASYQNRFAVNPIKRLVATRKVMGDRDYEFPVDIKVNYYGNPYMYVGEGKNVLDFFVAQRDHLDAADVDAVSNLLKTIEAAGASHVTDKESTGEIILNESDIRLMEKYMSGGRFSAESDVAGDIKYIKRLDDAEGQGYYKKPHKGDGKELRLDYLLKKNEDLLQRSPHEKVIYNQDDIVSEFSRASEELKQSGMFKGIRNDMMIYEKDGLEYGITKGGAVIDLRYLFSVDQQKEYIPGGYASGRPDDDFCPIQLEKGVEVEKEHVIKFTDTGREKKFKDTDLAKAKEIAKDHLAEIPDYYDRLEVLEESAKADGTFIDVIAEKKSG
jgi:hypothetical protein